MRTSEKDNDYSDNVILKRYDQSNAKKDPFLQIVTLILGGV